MYQGALREGCLLRGGAAAFYFVEVVGGEGVLWVELQGALEVLLRFIEVAGFGEGCAEIGFGHGIFGIQARSLGEFGMAAGKLPWDA